MEKPIYDIGKLYSINCFVGGYPLPIVEWAVQNCPNYPICEDSFTILPVIIIIVIIYIYKYIISIK